MNRIFCLETEWDQTMHDLKKKSTVLPLLDFLENTINIEYTFRQVATESDFNYYIDHLQQPSYSAYDLIYLLGCPVRCSEKQMLKSPVKLLI